MNTTGISQQTEEQIIETLPSGVTMVINGSPSIEGCREFLKTLIKANYKNKEGST
jgi:hypothetical protein